MKTYIGIDLHSNNSYFAVVDEAGDRLYHRRFSNNKESIMLALERVKSFGEPEFFAVESTYNWYWLVDILHDNGFHVKLANPAQIAQYNGLKLTDDKNDAFFLAELLRLNILPNGWICPREDRPVRDLLRTRMKLVQQRTAFKNSITSIIARQTGIHSSSREVLQMTKSEIDGLVQSPDITFRIGQLKTQVYSLDNAISMIEKRCFNKLHLSIEYKCLNSVPGIGPLLSMVIMVETGDLRRFSKSGKYTSYCRCVDSNKTSNGKNKGKNNKKNGNKYLSWAYAEAAINLKRYCPPANSYWQRKKSKGPAMLANKSLAAKLTKACFYMIRDGVNFDAKKLFGYEGKTLGALPKSSA